MNGEKLIALSNELGKITHKYKWEDGNYIRTEIATGIVQQWNGMVWVNLVPLRSAA